MAFFSDHPAGPGRAEPDELTELRLDGEGNLIDRAEGSGSLKAESKIIEVSHTTLKYVVPQIKKVRISAESK